MIKTFEDLAAEAWRCGILYVVIGDCQFASAAESALGPLEGHEKIRRLSQEESDALMQENPNWFSPAVLAVTVGTLIGMAREPAGIRGIRDQARSWYIPPEALRAIKAEGRER